VTGTRSITSRKLPFGKVNYGCHDICHWVASVRSGWAYVGGGGGVSALGSLRSEVLGQ